MVKISWKTCLKVASAAFLLFLAIHYWTWLERSAALLLDALGALLLGIAIAYVVNILMSFYERHYFPRRSQRRLVARTRRPVCMLGAIITLCGAIALIVWLVVPELWQCIVFLAEEIPPFFYRLLNDQAVQEALPQSVLEQLQSIDWWSVVEAVSEFLINGLGSAAGAVVSTVSGLFSGIVSVVLGVVFAIYLLADKDRLAGQADRLMRSYLSRRWLERVRYVLSVLNESFHKFIVGQVTEAVILGVLCTLGMLLFRFPYAAMVGSLVGFTALIPVAGAYIGAAAGAIMMLTVSPLKALLFLVFIVVLQQLEGNLIYPRVVGNSIGLPAIWVLVAISVGGGLFGILGMLLGVPITATLYRLLREDVMRREAQRAASVPRGEALEAEPKAADVSAESGTAQPEK